MSDAEAMAVVSPDYEPGEVPPAAQVLGEAEMAKAAALDAQLAETPSLAGLDRRGNQVSAGVRAMLRARAGYRSVATDRVEQVTVATVWDLDLLDSGTPWHTAVIGRGGAVRGVAWSASEAEAVVAHRAVVEQLAEDPEFWTTPEGRRVAEAIEEATQTECPTRHRSKRPATELAAEVRETDDE